MNKMNEPKSRRHGVRAGWDWRADVEWAIRVAGQFLALLKDAGLL